MKQTQLKILFIFLFTSAFFILSNCQTLKQTHGPSSISKNESGPPINNVAVPKEPFQCESAEDCFNKGKEAEKSAKREEARNYFNLLLDRFDGSFWSHRSQYLLAKWDVEEKGLLSEDRLLKLLKEYPEMADYIEKLIADNAFNQGNFSVADQNDTHILLIYPGTVLRPQILIQKGISLFNLKQYDQAEEMFTLFMKENPKDEKYPEILYRMFDLYVDKTDWEKAAKVFREVETKYPDSIWSQDAEKKLSLLNPPQEDSVRFKLSLQEQFSQGKNLYEIGRFEKALEIWKKLRQKAVQDEPFYPELELKMGLANVPLKKYPEATDFFDRVLKKHIQSDFAPEALLGLARIAVKEENENELRKIQKRGEKLFSQQEAYYKLLYLIGNYYDDHHQALKAHIYFQMIIKDLPQNPITADALWRESWTYYKEGNYPAAEKNISKLLEQFPASPLHAQGLYWRGRVNERRGDSDEAQADFKYLCQNFSHSYYCHLARKRLILGSEQTPTLQEPFSSITDVPAQNTFQFQQDDHFLKAKELMEMNLLQEASKEFNNLGDRYRDKSTLLQIDKELIQAGDFYHALKNLRGQFPDILDRGRSYDYPLLWELAYPNEAVEQIQKIATEAKIEPEFVAGIMREESVFDVRATSKSGALGLMQIMPFTGEWVAEQLGVASFVREKLYNQDINIRFGAFYLDHLNQKFQGNLFYVAASYNAGPEAVSKWIMNDNFTDIEEFVENIPYQETRYYVKRVIKSYEEFKEIRARMNKISLPAS
ncbi:MAG: transglycosylase SLT domain-containing protein [Nitrospiria bacterium]